MAKDQNFLIAIANGHLRGIDLGKSHAQTDAMRGKPFTNYPEADWSDTEGDNYGGHITFYNEGFNAAFDYAYKKEYEEQKKTNGTLRRFLDENFESKV